ncbi:hypothetical protein Tco_0386423 [Tanacetum coccineum]
MVVQNQSQMGKGSANPTDPHHTPTFIQPSPQPQKIQKSRKPKRKDTQVPQSSDPMENVADEAVYKELGDSLVRAATTDSNLEAEQDSGGGPSDEDRLKLDELMALCTTLQNRVLDLEQTKTTQHNEIASLKRRVKNLEKKSRSRTHRLKRLYKVGLIARIESSDDKESLSEDPSKQGRIDAIDTYEEITLVGDMNVSTGEEVVEEVVEVINTAKLIIDAAQVSAAGDKVSTATTISVAITTTATTDKGKGIFIEPVEPMKKKYQIRLDKETAFKLQAEFDEEERLAREKAKKEQEVNIALIET